MMRWSEISYVVDELAEHIDGGQLQKVRQPDVDTLVLFVRRPGRTTRLVLSCRPGTVRISATMDAVTTLPEPTALGAWVRAAGGGRAVRGLEVMPTDRIVSLMLSDGRLVVELTGPRANIYGVDDEHRVVVSARMIHGSRGLAIGATYHAPPTGITVSQEGSRYTDAFAVEAAARQKIVDEAMQADAARRRQMLKRANRKLTKLEQHIARDERQSEQAEQWKRRGELLKGQLHLVKSGVDYVSVQDWYSDGLPMVRIPLDPKLDGAANLAKIFRQYRRARDSVSHVAQRRAHLLELQQRLSSLEGSDVSIDDLETSLLKAGLIRPTVVSLGGGQQHARLPYRLFKSQHGEDIRVGKGGKDNHETTFRHARGNDYWLHVRDAPGAHVIVPCPGRGQEPHEETLRDAAALAVHYSRLRGETLVDVSYTQRKNIRPVKGAAPGRVSVAASKNICIADGSIRITRLFQGAMS